MQRNYSRKGFLRVSGAGLAGVAAARFNPVWTGPYERIHAGEVIERIKKQVAVPWRNDTVDTFKGGGPEMKVTGITTTFLATLDVLQRSAQAGRNFIITHEPTFWNNLDTDEGLTADPLYLYKTDFIRKNNLIVWRFHDHWHARKPDGIIEGQLEQLGWNKYHKIEINNIGGTWFELPQPKTLRAFAEDMKLRLQSDNIRVIGDPEGVVRKIANVSNHLHGSMEALPFADAFVIKEADRENDLAEWCRDTVSAGQKKGFVFISHNRGEEFGMDNCAKWLRTFISEVPVTFLPSGDPFWRTIS